MQNQNITTKRLYLRPFQIEDLTDYFEILQDKDNLRLAGQPVIQTETEAKRQLDLAMTQGTIAISLKSTGKVIGLIEPQTRFTGQPPMPDPTQIQIGYLLNRSYRRQGYMSEALRQLFVAFAQGGYTQVWAGVFLENEASYQLLEKLGFSYAYTIDMGLSAVAYQQKEAYYQLEIKN